MIHKDTDSVVAEIETSIDAALRAALKTLSDLDQEPGGLFVRESKRWRKAGTAS